MGNTCYSESIVGKDDEAAKKCGYSTAEVEKKDGKKDYFVEIPSFGRIDGYFELYKSPLDSGKSEEIGTSHGFFVLVRGRVINLADNRFGITGIPHLAFFNQMRVIVHADYLDDYLTASREDIFDTTAKDVLKKYLQAVYNVARSRWDKYVEDQLKKESLEDHLRNMPSSLLGFPLRQAIDRLISKDYNGFMIQSGPGMKAVPTIESIESSPLSPSDPLVSLQEGKLVVNTNHPFYAAYATFPGFRKIAVAEVLLEAYMVEADFDQGKIIEVLTRRDSLLRNLADRFPEGTLEVASSLKAAVDSERGLEIAIVDAFRALGFEATHIGGSGKPDGYAVAYLGFDTDGKIRKYTVTMDGKSTQEASVQSGNLELATVHDHMGAYHASYAIVVAVDYEGGDDETSKASRQAREQGVCLVRAEDFANLLVHSTLKPLSLTKFRELLEKRTPKETREWIKKFIQEKPEVPVIREILDTLWRMQQEDPKEPPSVSGARYKSTNLQKWTVEDIVGWLKVIEHLNPELLVSSGERILLNQTPENIIRQCVAKLNTLPEMFDKSSVAAALGEAESVK